MTERDAQVIVDFWREAGPKMWFAKDEAFDRRFHDRFLKLHEAAAKGDLANWSKTPAGSLALLILLDQFPRNCFRGTTRMYATDRLAREVAAAAIDAGHDQAFGEDLRVFFYLPFEHSEVLADQERSLALCRPLDQLAHDRLGRRWPALRGRADHRDRRSRAACPVAPRRPA